MKISRIRKLFALVFSSVIFVALAGIALFIARGNIITDQGLVETGSVRFNVNPSGTYQVFLNEQVQTIANNSVSNLTPGSYDLKIDKQGYTSWHQSIDIRAGLVTDVTVQLFPQDLKLEQLSKTNVDKVFFSPSHRYAYYAIINYPLGTQVGLWKQTLQQSNIPLIAEQPLKITNLTDLIAKDINGGKFTIKPSLDDTRILLLTTTATYVLDSSRYNEPATENKLDLSYPVDEINWLGSSSNLLIRSGNLLIDYDLNKKSSTIISYEADKTPIYSATNNSVTYLLRGKLYKYTSGNNTAVVLENVTLPENITTIQTGSSSDTDLILKDGTKLFYLNVTDSYLTELGAYDLVTMSPNGRNLIVSDGQKLTSITIDISLAFNSVQTQKKDTILTSDIDHQSILWDPNSNYFVFQKTGENTKLYSADLTGNNVTQLLSSDSLTSPAYYGLPENNAGLIVRLLDGGQTQTDTTEKRANLYRLGFTQ